MPGKAHFTGALICALVDLGRMKIVEFSDRSITLRKLNDEGYDSVYMPGIILDPNGRVNRDEFVVYEKHRVKKIIVCNLPKESAYKFEKYLFA